jgi:hypothetical protein
MAHVECDLTTINKFDQHLGLIKNLGVTPGRDELCGGRARVVRDELRDRLVRWASHGAQRCARARACSCLGGGSGV